MMVWAVIVGMGVVLLFNRYVFLEPRLPVRLGRHLQAFLGFAVPGMLTAICGPILFMPDHQLNLSLGNPYLLAGVCTVGLMLLTHRVLTSVVLGMVVFYGLRAWL
jgi:branched-subunit amino acid transport protein